MPLVQKLSHPFTPTPNTLPPNTPIPAPTDLHANLINTDPPHTSPLPSPCPHPHTKWQLENKGVFLFCFVLFCFFVCLFICLVGWLVCCCCCCRFFFFLFVFVLLCFVFTKTHPVQFSLSMYLNRHLSGLSEFRKTNRFSRYPFCFIIRLFFLYVQTVISRCLTI